MQIESIILYGSGNRRRILPFEVGTVNIISGKSYTGKSSLIDIIDYCLGSDNNISHNKIKNNVEWFGIKLSFADFQIFIARENPKGKKQSNSVMYLKGREVTIPQRNELKVTDDIETIVSTLTGFLGISALSDNGDSFSRDQYPVSLRHATKYMYQDQETVASKRRLFYNDEDSYVKQSIKDTIGYFLGVTHEDDLKLKAKLDGVKKRYRQLQRKEQALERVRGNDISKMVSLIEEAGAVGLLNIGLEDDFLQKEPKELFAVLRLLDRWTSKDKEQVANDRITFLQDQIQDLKTKAQILLNKINAAKSFVVESDYYSEEVEIQTNRLKTVGLYKKDPDGNICPLCAQKVDGHTPNIVQINKLLEKLNSNLQNVDRGRPNLHKYISKLEIERNEVLEKRAVIKETLDKLILQWEEAQKILDMNEQKAKVVGRISLFVESYQATSDNSELHKTLGDLEGEIKSIEAQLDPEEQEIRLQAALNKINNYMTEMAKNLDFEYSGELLRFDPKRLTVFVDLDDESIPLKGIGSAANHVSLHLGTFLALHKFFTLKNRPIPSILIIDQPTQAYYEPDQIDDEYKVKDEDREAVTLIYDLLFRVAKELDGKLQIIVTDHAYLGDHEDFKKSVVEIWRHETGKALVPYEWIENP